MSIKCTLTFMFKMPKFKYSIEILDWHIYFLTYMKDITFLLLSKPWTLVPFVSTSLLARRKCQSIVSAVVTKIGNRRVTLF